MGRRIGVLTLVIAILGLLAAAPWLVPESPRLVVNLSNESSRQLDGLSLVTAEMTKTVPAIAPGEVMHLRPYPSRDDETLALVDSRGRRYELIGYFMGSPRGVVDVRIHGASGSVLRGRVILDTDYPGAKGTFPLRPIGE